MIIREIVWFPFSNEKISFTMTNKSRPGSLNGTRLYHEGFLSVPASLSIIEEATVFTVSMLSLILLLVSMTKQRALLDPLKIPIILKCGRGKLNNNKKTTAVRNWNKSSVLLQEQFVSSCFLNVFQELTCCSNCHVGGRGVKMSVAWSQGVFVDPTFGLDPAGLINYSSMAALSFSAKYK